MLRHWRIQVSLICFVLCLASIVLWVRSYSSADVYGWVADATTTCDITSYRGDISFNRSRLAASMLSQQPVQLNLNNSPQFQASAEVVRNYDLGFLGIHGNSNSFNDHIAISYWVPTVLIGVLAGLPWYWRRPRIHFSLRNFLILVTIFALLLGMIAWLDRAWIGK
jgi:hypothetical protein